MKCAWLRDRTNRAQRVGPRGTLSRHHVNNPVNTKQIFFKKEKVLLDVIPLSSSPTVTLTGHYEVWTMPCLSSPSDPS